MAPYYRHVSLIAHASFFSTLITSVQVHLHFSADSFGLSPYPISLSNKTVIDNDLSQQTLLLEAEQKSLSKLDFYWCLRFTGLSCISIAGAVDVNTWLITNKASNIEVGYKRWALVPVKSFNERMLEELVMRGINTSTVS